MIETYFFIFGSVIGSFLGVVIERLPKQESLIYGRSHCNTCHKTLSPIELIPIFSFLMQKGRCRYCGTKLPIRYLILELITGCSFLISFFVFGLSFRCLIACILASILLTIAYIDLDTLIIFDRFHVFIILLAILEYFILSKSLIDLIIGALIISVPLFIIALVTGGMGGGDVKLMFAAGCLLGFSSTLVAFMIAAILGGTYGIITLAQKQHSRKDSIAFGPFLCIGIYFAYLFGPQLVSIYLSLF